MWNAYIVFSGVGVAPGPSGTWLNNVLKAKDPLWGNWSIVVALVCVSAQHVWTGHGDNLKKSAYGGRGPCGVPCGKKKPMIGFPDLWPRTYPWLGTTFRVSTQHIWSVECRLICVSVCFLSLETVALWLHLHLWRHRWPGWTTPPWAPADWQPSRSNLWWRAGPAVLFERPAVHNWMDPMTWHHNFIFNPTLIEMSTQGWGGNTESIGQIMMNSQNVWQSISFAYITIRADASWYYWCRNSDMTATSSKHDEKQSIRGLGFYRFIYLCGCDENWHLENPFSPCIEPNCESISMAKKRADIIHCSLLPAAFGKAFCCTYINKLKWCRFIGSYILLVLLLELYLLLIKCIQ